MSDQSDVKDDVIRKMLRPPPAARGRLHDTLLDLGSDLFRRAAKSAHDLNLEVTASQVIIRPVADALAALPEKRMVALLAHQTQRPGLMMFDATLLDALIEQQTLGEVLKSPRLHRPVTDIDRSMSEPFQRELLVQLSKLAGKTDKAAMLAGYDVLRMETDPVRLGLDLTTPAYEILQVTLDLGPGRKTGKVQLWFPAEKVPGKVPKIPGKPNPLLQEIVADVEVPLTISLPPVKLSVKKLMELEVGSLIPIDPGILKAADVRDGRGTALTKAHLGQLSGQRAVRLLGLSALATSPPATPQPALSQQDGSALPDLSKPTEEEGQMPTAEDTPNMETPAEIN